MLWNWCFFCSAVAFREKVWCFKRYNWRCHCWQHWQSGTRRVAMQMLWRQRPLTPREHPANDNRKPKHLKMYFLFKHVIVQLAILIFLGSSLVFFGMKHHAANLRPFIWMHFFKDVRVWRYLANQKTGRLIWILIMYNFFFMIHIKDPSPINSRSIIYNVFFGGDGISYNPHITG